VNLRRTVLLVASLNLIYFGVENYYGQLYDSVALIGDSVDFLEDASVNVLIAFAIGWSLKKRKYASYAFALFLLVPGTAFLWNAIQQFLSPEVPEGGGMGIVGFGALIVNTTCALLIARHREEEGGLVAAAYYSARNDAMANVLIIGAGLFTLRFPSIWPDLLIGIFIFLINADAAKEILETANKEGKAHRA
jgi:Co/Zn/Cd efflux system component